MKLFSLKTFMEFHLGEIPEIVIETSKPENKKEMFRFWLSLNTDVL